jgi:hypothetical protein
MRFRLELLGLIPLLARCAPENCNPSTAGFVGGIVGQVSGCYQARQDLLEQGLVQARTRALEERAEAERAAEIQATTSEGLIWRQRQLAALDSKIEALKAAIMHA